MLSGHLGITTFNVKIYNIVCNFILPTASNQMPSEMKQPAIMGPPSTPAVLPAPSPLPMRHRPILPRERSIFDKLIDAVVGDGPDHRFALICRRCAAHNGMALAEEFEFLCEQVHICVC